MDNENKPEDQNNSFGNLNININFYAVFSAIKRYFKQIIVVVAAVIAIFIFTRPNVCGNRDTLSVINQALANSSGVSLSEFESLVTIEVLDIDQLYKNGNETGCVGNLRLTAVDGTSETFPNTRYTVTRQGRLIEVEILENPILR